MWGLFTTWYISTDVIIQGQRILVGLNHHLTPRLQNSYFYSFYRSMDVSLDYILFHYISSLSTINISESSTLSNFDILIKHSTSGWLELVHHFEMVVLSFPSCSASHKPVFFFSTSNSFRRFNSLCVIIFNLYRKITNYYQQTCKNSLIFMLCSQQFENYSIVLCLFWGLNYNISLPQKQHIMPDTLTFTSVHTIPGAHASAAFTP